jgi:hypothetical protein
MFSSGHGFSRAVTAAINKASAADGVFPIDQRANRAVQGPLHVRSHNLKIATSA